MPNEIKTPPHSAEAERGIIGSILLDTQFGEDARVLDLCQARGLTPDSFYEPRNRILYAKNGILYALPVAADFGTPVMLKNFNGMKFEAVKAPY